MNIRDDLEIFGVVYNKQFEICKYITENTNPSTNTFIGTYSKISKDVNVSRPTISTIMKKLQANNFIKKVQNGVWLVDSDFIEKIKKEDIKVVGLTNYINFSNKDFELAKKLRDKGIVVFYNLELRLTNLNDEEQLSDYHIIFSDELSPQNIKDVLANIIVKVGHTEKTANSITDKNDFQRAAVDFEELHKVLSSESLIRALIIRKNKYTNKTPTTIAKVMSRS